MMMNEEAQSWESLILRHSTSDTFKSRTCKIYDSHSTYPDEPDKLCPCGRMIRRHSFVGESVQSKEAAAAAASTTDGKTQWQPPADFPHDTKHSTKLDINVFGTLETVDCKFLRIDERVAVKDVFQLIHEDCGGKYPALILSIYGGAKYFTMTERLEKEFIRGVIDAATVADAWILTAGISNGVSKLVGEGISHYRLLREYSNKVKCIGMTMWGTINENTRHKLKEASRLKPFYERQIPEDTQEDKEAIETNHTHCILFDSGKLNAYLADTQRDKFVDTACETRLDNQTCYPVTIIVEGGFGSLEVLKNDIAKERSIVCIQGSGRLADILATLVEQTSNPDRDQQWSPSKQDIEQAIERFYPYNNDSEISSSIKQIQDILKEEHRHFLHVFSLDRDKNVAETIFKAIFTAKNKKRKLRKDKTERELLERKKKLESELSELKKKPESELLEHKKKLESELLEHKKKIESELLEDEKQRRIDEDKLVDLALEWNYFDGVLPILQARQGEMVKKKNNLITEDIFREKELFLKSLQKNRPTFVEYFLSAGFDPLTLAEKEEPVHSTIFNLYFKSYMAMNRSHQERITSFFGRLPLESIKEVDHRLNKLIGSFFGPMYSTTDDNFQNRIHIDLTNHICTCCQRSRITENDLRIQDKTEHKYTKHHMLRDLFLWSIFMDMPDMAKVLLLHVRSRICAALIASALFKKYSELSSTVDMKDKFERQALDFETYAAISLDKCYEYNEKRACELLLRRIPLFGNTTCMQVAISSESRKLLITACFDRTLNQVWFDKLSLTNQQSSGKLAQIPSIITVGLAAPLLLDYRNEEKDSLNDIENEPLSQAGIDYYISKSTKHQSRWKNYQDRFRYFHTNPMMKMAFHFLSYIFFILVFSYMMLYHLDGRGTFVVPHWTELYVIITVSTMFCEEIRKIYSDYDTRMVERWGSTGSTLFTFLSNVFYIVPYVLFFLGLGFRYASYTDELLSTARIIWALDLEFWYLRSLKFVMALKILGPKLFMLKNMLRDLFAFVYMIFIAIAAYGVVSRSLILYKQVPFTGRGIFNEIFYAPYWFMYGTVSDKDLLDQIINNGTTPGTAEATATHVLLAFHMLFINILLLNLLIAVFADSIGKVQENTEFYWRYQRYSFVREYFERLPLGYPPLIIIPHVILLILFLHRKCCPQFCRNQVVDLDKNYVSLLRKATPIFKMIPVKESKTERWDLFENAATHSYARSVLEINKTKDKSIANLDKSKSSMATKDSETIQTTGNQTQTVDNIKDELMSAFKVLLTDTQKGFEQNNTKLEKRLDQLMEVVTKGKVQ